MRNKIFYFLCAVALVACQPAGPAVEDIKPINHRYQFSSEIDESFQNSEEPWRFQQAATEHSYIGNL